MTRELLLEYICPGYRAPACFKGDISFNCSDCNHVLNEMLDRYDKQIREDVIDEFAKKLKSKCRKCYVDCDPYGSGIEEDSILYEDDIDEIAKQLKEQNK